MHLILSIYALCATWVYADPNNCITYRGTKGICVTIKQCPPLLNILKRRKSSFTTSLVPLHKSHCGFAELDPMVCCSSELLNDEESLPPRSITSAASFSHTISGSSEQTTCKTASGNEGSCITVNECPSLYAVFKQETTVGDTGLQILKQSICGFEKMIPKVCCNDYKHPAAESTTLSSQSNQIISSNSKPEECITPAGAAGTCVTLKQCQSLFNLLKRSTHWSFEVSQTLNKSQCGFENMDPKVCCENEKPSPSPSLDQPTDRPAMPTPPDITNHPSLQLLDHDLCGPVPETRIFGGTKTAVFEFPWMALIAYDTGSELPEFRCGGSLVTKKHVLTAAHCITALPPDLRLIGVRLGEHDLSKERDCDTDIDGSDINCAEDYQDFSILAVAVHPDYPKDNHQNDIGLIMLDGEANFEAANVRPICLPVSLTSVLSTKMIVTGWGATEIGPQSLILRKVTLPIVSNEECAKMYKMRNIKIWHKQICAGGSNRTDSCSGDSGGPLQTIGMYHGRPKSILYGVVSFGPRDCGSEHIPGVYTRVEYYMDWLLNTIGVEISDD